jgi:tricarballylate dehydrogenase
LLESDASVVSVKRSETKELSGPWDVLILGGGNAGLCAAITGRQCGASVLVLECAPREFRGGNSRHTRNLRYVHARAGRIMTGPYLEEEFWEDLWGVTAGKTNEALARLTIRNSADFGEWMPRHGVRFQPPLSGTLHLGRTNAFFLGGGKALVNAYYREAEALGAKVAYEAEVQDLEIRGGELSAVVVSFAGATQRVRARAVVAASGGFEANIPWLKESWGEVAENFIIRGTPYNQGRVLRALLDRGAKPVGDPRQFHAVAVDGRAPKFDGGIVSRVDCVPFGIVVNHQGARFYDEGEDFWAKRYAIWGRLVAQQPRQIGYAIIDSKPLGRFMPTVFPPVVADSIRDLAAELLLDPDALEATVKRFNGSVRPGTFDSATLDDCRTEGLDPPKSHWAVAIDRPPFHGYSLRPGITFTYLGVAIDDRARILMADGSRSANMFAAGEIMAGNVLGQGYLAGFGMTIGTVFGRIAGREAAMVAARRTVASEVASDGNQ